MAKLEIKVDALGQIVELETSGFKGGTCAAFTARLTKAVNPKASGTVETDLKPEFHEQATANTEQVQQGW